MTDEVRTTEASIETGLGKLKVSGANVHFIFTIIGCFLTGLVAYALWTHTEEAKASNKAFVEAVKEQTVAVKEQTVAQREQNCLISLPQGQRDPEFCRRIAR